jgi:hypothetical protein
MLVFQYDNLFRTYNRLIIKYARKIDSYDYDDYAQEIRLYVFNNIKRFDPAKCNIDYYMYLLVITAYRRIIFDKKSQQKFEEGFSNISHEIGASIPPDCYDEILNKIVLSLKKDIRITIFYAVLYSKDNKKFSEIARSLNMEYDTFMFHFRKVREIIKNIFVDYRFLAS